MMLIVNIKKCGRTLKNATTNKERLKYIKSNKDINFIPGRGKVVLLTLSEFNFLLKMAQVAIKNEQNKEAK